MWMTDVGDDFKMLVTVLAVFATNILYLLTLRGSVGNQHAKDVTNIEIMSPRPNNCRHYPLVTNIYVAALLTGFATVTPYSYSSLYR